MKKKTADLQGSSVGVALTACGSKLLTKTKRLIRYLIRSQRHLHINNNQGGCINFILVDYTKEEIKQLIMEYNNHQKPQNHE